MNATAKGGYSGALPERRYWASRQCTQGEGPDGIRESKDVAAHGQREPILVDEDQV